MAFTTTTLSSAVGVDDTLITVASATGFSAGRLLRIDDEYMQVAANYGIAPYTTTLIPVLRGREGSKTKAHVATAGVQIGTQADDWDAPGTGSVVNSPIPGRSKTIVSITATPSTLAFGSAGVDQCVRLNGTAAITLTIPVPTADMDFDELNIASDGVAQHLLTFTGGLSGAGGSYDIITINATAPAAFKFVAANILWMAYCQPPMGGTVTNIIGSIA